MHAWPIVATMIGAPMMCRQHRIVNFDVGYNRGRASRYMLARNPDLCIVAFEPIATKPMVNVELVPAAVSSAPGPVLLWRGRNQHNKTMSIDESTIKKSLSVYQNLPGGTYKQVPTVQLRNYIKRVAGKLALLKVDAQGSDFDAVKTAGHYLRRFSCVSMELWGKQAIAEYASPLSFMRAHGFEPVDISPSLLTSGRFFQKQVLFARCFTHRIDLCFVHDGLNHKNPFRLRRFLSTCP